MKQREPTLPSDLSCNVACKSASPPPIRIAAAIIRDTDKRVLLVRKRGTRAFMQPGGKIEVSETPVQALKREIIEELGTELSTLRFIKRASAVAANEPGHYVDAFLFEASTAGPISIGAEIEEAIWVDAYGQIRHEDGTDYKVELAPLSKLYVLPLLKM